MTFISDGKRTWDPDRGLDLKIIGGLQTATLEISSVGGRVRFDGEWSAYRVSPDQWIYGSDNQSINSVVQWNLNIHFPVPGYSNEETMDILRDAMKAFETGYGRDSKNGHTPRDVICRFSGRITSST